MSDTDFFSYLKTLEPEDWHRMATDAWTVKDVVAHMVSWEKEAAAVIQSAWDRKEPPWFMKTDDYDEFNRKSVLSYKNYTPAQLVEEWERWQKKVEEEIERVGEYNLKTRPDLFGWLFEPGDGSHYEHHYRQVKRAIEKR